MSSALIRSNIQVNSRGLSAAGLFADAALRPFLPPAAFPAGPAPRASLPWRARRRKPHSSQNHQPRDPVAEGLAAATSWSVPAAGDTRGRYDINFVHANAKL